jgi:hypothetical protein
MENEVKTWHILVFMLLATIMVFMIYNRPLVINNQITTSSMNDSLINKIDSLESELIFQSNGFDHKEKRYEEVISEYEFGLDRLKYSHPEAYREFHRIVAFKERYSRDSERENVKRLKSIE